MDETTAVPARNRPLKWVLVVLSLLALAALLPALGAAMMSPMMADSGAGPAIMALILITLTFPVALILFPVLAWIAFARGRDRRALVMIALPLLWLVVFAAIYATTPGA